MESYVYLFLAIFSAYIGSSMLKISNGFTVIWATAVCIIVYVLSYYFFSVALKKIPLFLGYAILVGAKHGRQLCNRHLYF